MTINTYFLQVEMFLFGIEEPNFPILFSFNRLDLYAGRGKVVYGPVLTSLQYFN